MELLHPGLTAVLRKEKITKTATEGSCDMHYQANASCLTRTINLTSRVLAICAKHAAVSNNRPIWAVIAVNKSLVNVVEQQTG